MADALARPALTSLAAGAGCGCKLGPADLLPVVNALPRPQDPRLLVGSATADDAAVFRLREDLALVQTIDFFTPLVDDPYDFGRIAAANALSDVYAMGGTPLTALNVVAFPLETLGADVLAEVLRGGADVVAAAGAVVAGGHSIADAEPKYGLAVTGVVDPARMTTNAGGRAGDALVLTKPLGTGAVVTARKRGHVDDDLLARAVAVMTELNAGAAAAAAAAGVRGATDVTGFGLLGHLHGLCRESGVAAELDAAAVPTLAGVEPLLVSPGGMAGTSAATAVGAELLLERPIGESGGSGRNAAWAAAFTTFAEHVPAWRRRLLADATTSGGLLLACDPARAAELPGTTIGRLVAGSPGAIRVT